VPQFIRATQSRREPMIHTFRLSASGTRKVLRQVNVTKFLCHSPIVGPVRRVDGIWRAFGKYNPVSLVRFGCHLRTNA